MFQQSKRTCPVCAVRMRLEAVHGMLVDRCGTCQGVWLDSFEIDRVLSAQPSLPVGGDSAEPALPPDKPRLCSACAIPMVTFNFAYDSNVFLERCERCGGIWADRDEAARAASHLRGIPAQAASARALIQELGSERLSRDYYEFWKSLSAPAGLGSTLIPKLVIPIGDVNPRAITPVVTISLIAANVLAGAAWIAGAWVAADPVATLTAWAFVPATFANGEAPYTLATHLFLHAGPLHLAFNMFFLWTFGDNVEESLGRWRYLAHVAGFAAGAAGGHWLSPSRAR